MIVNVVSVLATIVVSPETNIVSNNVTAGGVDVSRLVVVVPVAVEMVAVVRNVSTGGS